MASRPEQSSSYYILGPSPSKEIKVWVADSEASACMRCKADFTLFRRKHHLRCLCQGRKCGRVVCDSCSSGRLPVEGYTGDVRVCDACVVFDGGPALSNSKNNVSEGAERSNHCVACKLS